MNSPLLQNDDGITNTLSNAQQKDIPQNRDQKYQDNQQLNIVDDNVGKQPKIQILANDDCVNNKEQLQLKEDSKQQNTINIVNNVDKQDKQSQYDQNIKNATMDKYKQQQPKQHNKNQQIQILQDTLNKQDINQEQNKKIIQQQSQTQQIVIQKKQIQHTQIYSQPVQIPIPSNLIVQNEIKQVDVIIPCIFQQQQVKYVKEQQHKQIDQHIDNNNNNKNHNNSHNIKQNIKAFKTQNLKSEQSIMQSSIIPISPQYQQQPKDQSIIYSQAHFTNNTKNQISRTKIMTSVLLDKISDLQQKIKDLEQQKHRLKENQQQLRQLNNNKRSINQYQTTPTKANQYGSIIKNQQFSHNINKKQFNSISNQTYETNHHPHNFRVRNFGNVSRNASNNKIYSNVYNQTLIQNSRESSLVRQEIKTLKDKIRMLQNNYSLSQKKQQSSNQRILQDNSINNFRQRTPLNLNNLEQASRNSFKGKIVKRNISQFSPSNQSSYSSQAVFSPQNSKGFVRSGHPVQAIRQLTEQQLQENKNNYEQKKRIDSSAIFRKKQDNPTHHNMMQFQTLQFNPQKQKLIIDSKQTDQFFYNDSNNHSHKKNHPISPILYRHKQVSQKLKKQQNQLLFYQDISIPDLQIIPNAKNSSEELIQIGKLTFIKLGFQINQSTQLSVKKYKNCVHFSITNQPQQNILWHYDNKFYYGGWKTYTNGQGEKFGEGLEIYPNKYKFKGNFIDGKRHGHGTLITNDQDNSKIITVYAGQFEQGYKNGHGKQIDNDGQYVYVGQFKNNKKNGYGKIYHNLELQFQGVFVKGLKNGYGKQTYQNGDVYDGNYVNNKFQGKGMYKWHSGAIYSGEFVNGKRQGQGIWRTDQDGLGDSYEGDYFQDMKHGYGIYKWANGCVYQGGFQKDIKHGEGKMTYENGKVAHLIWQHGKVQKKVDLTSRPKESKSVQKRPGSNIAFKTHHSSHKKISAARSAQKLTSAKSTSSIPRGIVFRKDQLQRVENKGNNQSKTKGNELLKIKLGQSGSFRSKNFTRSGQDKKNGVRGPPKDPPYRGMQTTSNISMNM